MNREYPTRPIASASAVVLRGERVLLVKRAHPPSQGRWSLPGGVIELGETVQGAARREVYEECGVEIEAGEIINVADNIVRDENGRIRFHYILIYVRGYHVSGKARPSSDALDIRWATQEELDTLDVHPIAQRVVQQAFGSVK